MNILSAMTDPAVFGLHLRDKANWQAWSALLAALFGLPMDEEQLALFRQCTGRQELPSKPFNEGWLVIARRGGKSFILAMIAVFLACFKDWRPYLGPGERATVMVIAADRKQARVIMRYVKGLLQSVPMLAATIESETNETISLSNRVTIEIHSASFRSIRGYSVCVALCDEIAFWPTEDSANPDIEILAALRPAMATIPGAILLCASSPYARRGALWEAWRKHYGKDGDPVLVWQAATRTMNPTVPQSVIDQALADDPAHARAEWLAEFRSDVEAFVAEAAVQAVISEGVRERTPLENVHYYSFVDPSGGAADSMTLAIAHREGKGAILDCIREVRPPFSPESVVVEFSKLLKNYRISKVRGDRYAGEWPRQRFRTHGIEYIPAHKSKSDLYRDLLPAVNSGLIDLLDHDRLTAQLTRLERRTGRGGRDSIDHAPGAHDDVANACAGALVTAIDRERFEQVESLGLPVFINLESNAVRLNDEFDGGPYRDSPATANWRRQQ